jgi:glycosyltransferase involved in cell wall biosynthesis
VPWRRGHDRCGAPLVRVADCGPADAWLLGPDPDRVRAVSLVPKQSIPGAEDPASSRYAPAMRILFSAYAVSPLRGSEPGTSWRVVEALAARGHEVVVLTSDRLHEDMDDGSTPEGIEVVRVGTRSTALLSRGNVSVYSQYVRWQHDAARRAASLLLDRRVDVVHHFSWGSAPWGSPLARLGRPFVFGPIGGGYRIPSELYGVLDRPERRRERMRELLVRSGRFNPLTRGAAKRSALALAGDRWTADLLRGAGARRVESMIHDITPPALLASPPDARRGQRRRVLWVGRALPRKGLRLAIRTIASTDNTVTMSVVGEGPEQAACLRLARTLGVADRVEFHGAVPWQRVVDELDACDVFLFSSLRDSFGAQLLEAAARGRPIVGIDHQAIREWVPLTTGGRTPVADEVTVARGLAREVERLLDDDEDWSTASAASRRFAERHTAESKAVALESAYAGLVLP